MPKIISQATSEFVAAEEDGFVTEKLEHDADKSAIETFEDQGTCSICVFFVAVLF